MGLKESNSSLLDMSVVSSRFFLPPNSNTATVVARRTRYKTFFEKKNKEQKKTEESQKKSNRVADDDNSNYFCVAIYKEAKYFMKTTECTSENELSRRQPQKPRSPGVVHNCFQQRFCCFCFSFRCFSCV